MTTSRSPLITIGPEGVREERGCDPSVPVPTRLTMLELPVLLSIVSEPLIVPVDVGMNSTLIIQLPPIETLSLQLFDWIKPDDVVMSEMYKGAVPPLVSLTDDGALIPPMS